MVDFWHNIKYNPLFLENRKTVTMNKQILLMGVIILLSSFVFAQNPIPSAVYIYDMQNPYNNLIPANLQPKLKNMSVTSITGINGDASHFVDTSSAYLYNSSIPISLSGNYTISLWFNNTNKVETDTILLLNGTNNIYVNTQATDNRLQTSFGSEKTLTGYLWGTEWHNIVFVINTTGSQTGHQIWINGKLNATDTSYSPIAPDNHSLYIGSTYTPANFFNGDVDEFYMWNRSLDDSEVIQLWNSGIGLFFSGQSDFVPPTPEDNSANNTYSNIIINITSSFDNIAPFWNGTPIGNGSEHSPFSFELNNTLIPTEAQYNYWVCNGDICTQNRTWTYDATDPTITINPNNFFNIFNESTQNNYIDNLQGNITLNDQEGLFGFLINITYQNGTEVYSYKNETLTATSFNFDLIINSTNWTNNNLFNINTIGSDGHTMGRISNYTIKEKTSELEFYTTEGNNIIIKTTGWADTKATKTKDRYSFEFDYLFTKNKERTYDIYCDGKLYYREHSNYESHFICSKDGLTGNWIDFEGIGKSNNIKKITDNHYKIIFDDVPKTVKFNSIGGLNVNSQNYTWYKGKSTFGGNTVLSGSTTTIFLNLTKWAKISDFKDVSLYHNNTVFTDITNINYIGNSVFSKELSTNLEYGEVDIPYYWNFTAIQTNINYSASLDSTQTLSSWGVDNCSNIYNLSSNATTLNISFININGDTTTVNLTAQINYGTKTYHITQENINNSIYCIYPSWFNTSYTSSMQYIDLAGSTYYNSPSGYLSNITTQHYFYTSLGTSQTTFSLKDSIDKQKAITNAQCISYLFIDGEYTQLETKTTDIAGQIVFNYLPNNNYEFVCSSVDYSTHTFILNPINSETWDIFLTPSTIATYSNTFDRIGLYINPPIYYTGLNDFNLTIHSYFGELTSYSYTLTYPGGTTSDIGYNAYGEGLNNIITIINPSLFDEVQLDITYSMPLFGTKSLTYFYSIGNLTNGTLIQSPDNDPTYGMGMLERLIIVMFGAILIMGLCVLAGMELPGILLQGIWGAYWCIVKFVPWWAFLPSIFIAIIIISGRSE